MKDARVLKLSATSKANTYICQHKWPPSCFVQAGDCGIVFANSELHSYRTAFFEALPDEPDTLIRGQGATIAEAEEKTWEQYQRILACPEHEFERRGYKNGVGFCKHCGMFSSHAFEPSTKCVICGCPTYWTHDTDNNRYCKVHQREKPLDKWTEIDWHIAHDEYNMWKWDCQMAAQLR